MSNTLYPIFLRLDRLEILIVGGGYVAMEKLHFILKSSPNARLTVVAPEIRPEIKALVAEGAPILLIQSPFDVAHLEGKNLIVAATNLPELNKQVHAAAKALGLIVNVADTPALCDFYMGSIVTRGDLKVAISTNGKSPTFAKRFRQLLENTLPEEIDDLLSHLKILRDQLTLDFEGKVEYLNEVTKSLISEDP